MCFKWCFAEMDIVLAGLGSSILTGCFCITLQYQQQGHSGAALSAIPTSLSGTWEAFSCSHSIQGWVNLVGMCKAVPLSEHTDNSMLLSSSLGHRELWNCLRPICWTPHSLFYSIASKPQLETQKASLLPTFSHSSHPSCPTPVFLKPHQGLHPLCSQIHPNYLRATGLSPGSIEWGLAQ